MPIPRKLTFRQRFVRRLRDDSSFFARPARILQTLHPSLLRSDVTAGLTVAVVMLPQAIAYAMIAELPPQTGLYAAVVAAIFGALWGSSKHLHTGPTNAISLIVLATLLSVAEPGSPRFLVAAGYLAVLVGIVQIIMGFARMGALVNFVADSVVVGFTAGAAVLISVNQLKHLLRLEFHSSPEFFETIREVAFTIDETHWPSLALGAGTLAAILVLKRLRPRWPSALIAMVGAAAVTAFAGLDGQGVRVLGELPRRLPPLADLPLLDPDLLFKLSAGALAIAAIGLVEAMSIARSIASQTGQRLDANQEFVGQGLANMAAGFFSGYPVSGSFTRSAVNHSAGGRTPLAAVFSGLWVLVAVLLLAPLAVFLPRAAVAAVLLATAFGMIEWKEIRRILKLSQGDSVILGATFLATLALPLELAVLAGVLVSFGRFLAKTSAPRVRSVVPNAEFRRLVGERQRPVCPQMAIIEIEGPLYFGAVHHVEEAIERIRRAHPGQVFLLLRLGHVDHIDVSGIHMLESLVRSYRGRGGDVFLDGVRPQVLYMIYHSGLLRTLGHDNLLRHGNAIGHLFHHTLHPGICIYECEHRVFAECQALSKHSESEDRVRIGEIAGAPLHELLPSEVKLRLDSDEQPPLLVDVGEVREYERWHIAGSINVPLPRVANPPHDLPRDRTLVLVSRAGRRGALAERILTGQGYGDVHNLKGGMLGWEAAGYAIAVE